MGVRIMSMSRNQAINEAVRLFQLTRTPQRVLRPKGCRHDYTTQAVREPLPKKHVTVVTIGRSP